MRRQPTEEEIANIVDRYQRGQGLDFICLATSHTRRKVTEILRSRGVKIRKFGRQSRSSWGWNGTTLAALLALSVVACGAPPESAPLPQVEGLDELAARVTALEERRNLAAWCEPGCPAGVAEVRVKRDGIACRCVRPNVGVLRPLPGPGRGKPKLPPPQNVVRFIPRAGRTPGGGER